MQFQFRRGVDIGSLDAESDQLLLTSFVNKGDIDIVVDTNSSKCILLGRTGIGKSALMRYLESNHENVVRINPADISLRHLSNSDIIKFFKSIDVKLDLFYKVLWKHIFIVELIKRYFNDNLSKSNGILDWFRGKAAENKKRQKAINYLEKWETKFWEDTEYRVREIESSLRERFKNELGGSVGLDDIWKLAGKSEAEFDQLKTTKTEVIHKAQKVINESQIEEIKEILELMKDELFVKTQRKFYLIIDDLDKDWVSSEIVYDLIKSLIEVTKELNDIPNVKIIISLRSNILKKIFRDNTSRGIQREKFLNMYLDILWSKKELATLINNRLAELMKGAYTNRTPVISDIIPPVKKNNQQGFDYMLDRTLMRPRDIIDFFNKCILKAAGRTKITLEIIKEAEEDYSNDRLDALNDEWLENYGDIVVLSGFLSRQNPSFTIVDIKSSASEYLLDIIAKGKVKRLNESLQTEFEEFGKTFDGGQILKKILIVLYEVGVLGIKLAADKELKYSSEGKFYNEDDLVDETRFYVHPMFYKALRIKEHAIR